MSWLDDMAREPQAAPSRRVWGVGALVRALGDTLQARYGVVTVRGEVSGWNLAASGHAYFTLKDESGQAAMRCAMFRRAASQLAFAVREGQTVEARGKLTLYEARGELQLVVDALQLAGAGALYEQFLRLKARMSALGWFDPERKRALPSHPERVAVVTSLGAAALRDVLTALKRRVPHVEVVVVPCLVQGPEAPAQIAAALASLSVRTPVAPPEAAVAPAAVDVALLCRGGGALEDLWAFNDERVVKAVVDCAVPVICGVGHETDVTLADLAADLRAPTPTAAAELLCAAREQSLAVLEAVAGLLQRRVSQRLDGQAQRLDRLASRLVRPAQAVQAHRLRLGHLQSRLPGQVRAALAEAQRPLPALQQRWATAASRHLERHHLRLNTLGSRLQALNPRAVLERGYAWVADAQGRPVTQAAALSVGQSVVLELADGRAQAHVDQVDLT